MLSYFFVYLVTFCCVFIWEKKKTNKQKQPLLPVFWYWLWPSPISPARDYENFSKFLGDASSFCFYVQLPNLRGLIISFSRFVIFWSSGVLQNLWHWNKLLNPHLFSAAHKYPKYASSSLVLQVTWDRNQTLGQSLKKLACWMYISFQSFPAEEEAMSWTHSLDHKLFQLLSEWGRSSDASTSHWALLCS